MVYCPCCVVETNESITNQYWLTRYLYLRLIALLA